MAVRVMVVDVASDCDGLIVAVDYWDLRWTVMRKHDCCQRSTRKNLHSRLN